MGSVDIDSLQEKQEFQVHQWTGPRFSTKIFEGGIDWSDPWNTGGVIATGGTAKAAAKLVEISGGNVASFIFVINLFDLNGSDNLIKKGYKVESLIEFPGH